MLIYSLLMILSKDAVYKYYMNSMSLHFKPRKDINPVHVHSWSSNLQIYRWIFGLKSALRE